MAALTVARSRPIGRSVPSGRSALKRQRDVLADRALHQQRLGAVARHIGQPGGDGVGGMAEVDLRAVDLDRRRCWGGDRPPATSKSSSWPWPSSATTPSDLAGVEIEGDIVQLAGRREGSRTAQARRLSPRAAPPGAATAASASTLPPSIRSTMRFLDARRDVDDADRLAVAQHGGAVAERRDLDEAVRDEDHRPAGLGSAGATTSSTRSARSAGSAAVISSSSSTSGSTRQRAGQVEHAQDGERQVARRRRARSRSATPSSRHPVRKGSTGVPVSRRFGQHVEVGDQRRFLIDRDQAGAARLGRANECARAAPRIRMRPAVGPDRAGQDLDQRRLAGAVRAHQRMHLARPHRKRGVTQGGHGAVGLGDAGGVEERLWLSSR